MHEGVLSQVVWYIFSRRGSGGGFSRWLCIRELKRPVNVHSFEGWRFKSSGRFMHSKAFSFRGLFAHHVAATFTRAGCEGAALLSGRAFGALVHRNN